MVRNAILEFLGLCFLGLYLAVGYVFLALATHALGASYENLLHGKKIMVETVQLWVCDCP